MNATLTPTPDAADLKASFEAFSEVSACLEEAYDRLRVQVASLDGALTESNHRLSERIEELDETASHLRTIVESLGTGVVVCDPTGRITLVNRAFADLLGASTETLVGRRRHDLRDLDANPVLADLAGRGDLRTLRLREDEVATVRSMHCTVRNSHGDAIGTLDTVVDLTETEALRTKIRQSETLVALGEMAAGIAHEIRNPLNSIGGFASLLSHAHPDPETPSHRHAQRIVRGVERANTIITNLLAFARPDSMRPRRLPVKALVERLAQNERDENRTLRIDMADDADHVELHGDAILLERALANLIDNARQAGDGTTNVRLVVRLDRRDGVFIRVEDDGPGIDPTLRGRLFHPFVTGREDGVGLGLAIVHRIVDLHDGTIRAIDLEPTGTAFELRLPTRQAMEKAASS